MLLFTFSSTSLIKYISIINDRRLIIAAKIDHELFSEIYKKYSNNIYRYFFFRVGCEPNIAEDLMQNTFMRSFNALSRYEFQDHIYLDYLLKIAHNLLIDHYRQYNPIISIHELHDALVAENDLRDYIFMQEEINSIWTSIETFLPSEREVFEMKYKNDMCNKDISLKLDKSIDAIKSLLSRVLRKLRERFDNENQKLNYI